jgi:PII-like signaling protein
MTMSCIRFFVREGMRHAGQPIHDWLFQVAREAGIGGGSAFRASAGFGRHGLHEDTFFELAGKLPETVEFVGDQVQIEALAATVGKAGLRLHYVTYPVTLAVTGD